MINLKGYKTIIVISEKQITVEPKNSRKITTLSQYRISIPTKKILQVDRRKGRMFKPNRIFIAYWDEEEQVSMAELKFRKHNQKRNFQDIYKILSAHAQNFTTKK
jgi:hypothetical protein